MAIETTIKYSSAESVSTLSGDIRLEQSKGRLVIYDTITQRELVEIDRTGFLFSDANNRRIKIGSAPDDGRVGNWISKPGTDVITQLGG